MGSPRVFQTAPPQPASNARMTWSPQFVGGAEASQKGLGERILPAKRTERSGAIFFSLMRCLQDSNYSEGGAFAVCDSVHYFAAAVDAIATREILGIGGLTGGAVDLHAAVFDFDAAERFKKSEQRRLANSRDESVAGNAKFGAWNAVERAVGRKFNCCAFDRLDGAAIGREVDRDRLRPPAELHSFFTGLVVFKRERGDMFFVATIEDLDGFSAEAAGGAGSVNGGVACTDDDYATTNREVVAGFIARDEIEGICHAGVAFICDTESVHRAQADA